MFDYIEQLRKKPIMARRRLAILLAVGLTAVIIVIWVSTLDFGGTGAQDTQTVSTDLAPFEEIKTSLSVFYDSVKTMAEGLFSQAATST